MPANVLKSFKSLFTKTISIFNTAFSWCLTVPKILLLSPWQEDEGLHHHHSGEKDIIEKHERGMVLLTQESRLVERACESADINQSDKRKKHETKLTSY